MAGGVSRCIINVYCQKHNISPIYNVLCRGRNEVGQDLWQANLVVREEVFVEEDGMSNHKFAKESVAAVAVEKLLGVKTRDFLLEEDLETDALEVMVNDGEVERMLEEGD